MPTVARTRTFLAVLSQTGCVTDAARVAGISRKSVNDARARFDAFDRACSTALARAGRGLKAIAYERAVVGREMVIIRDGKEVERRIMPSDSMLGLLLKRGDLGDGIVDHGDADPEARRHTAPAMNELVGHRETFGRGAVGRRRGFRRRRRGLDSARYTQLPRRHPCCGGAACIKCTPVGQRYEAGPCFASANVLCLRTRR